MALRRARGRLDSIGMAESPYPMLLVPDAQALVLAQTVTLPPTTLPLQDALGYILAEDVYARDPLPPFPASIKDGYAVVAADGPGEYVMAGEVTAGRVADFTLQPGTVAYITTGAPIPAGADAVVQVEDTERLASPNGTRVRIHKSVRAGEDIRTVGSDVAAGQRVLEAGERLAAAEIGLLATVGVAQVPVVQRPRVAILSSGDELVEPSADPGPGQIRDSNRATLAAAIIAAGAEVVDLGIAPDVRGELEARVQRGMAEADILLSTGGVSMGELDLIKPLLEQAGTVHFGRLRMKPGKPCTFATADVGGRRRLVFGLPGNPVSSLVTFYLLVLPAIRKLAGWPDPSLRRVHAFLAQPLALDDYRPEYHRATLRWDGSLNEGRGGYLATSTGRQASSRLLSMRTANALLELPQGEGELAAGSVVTALVIGEV